MLKRAALEQRLNIALRWSPAVVLLGPRQVGKTTLARAVVGRRDGGDAHFFDLEDPIVEAQMAQPMTVLRPLRGLVVIDEIQRAPELFKVLRVLIDREERSAQFLLLGSVAPQLLSQTSESLAGLASDNYLDRSATTILTG